MPPEEAPSEPARPRVLLVIDLAGASPPALERGLGLSPYEAGLRARRGGLHLHGVFDEDAAAFELERLRGEGLAVLLLPEAEVRMRPLRALGGEQGGGRLWLRTEEQELTLAGEELLIIVLGPIARQHQPDYRGRRVSSASLEEGYRVHLHRRFDPRPVEIDPANFEFDLGVTGSARLEIDAWLLAVGPGVPLDDGFRWLPPAFGVAEPEPRTALSAASSLARAGRSAEEGGPGEAVLLDNTAQFRFYSAWRGAVERRRSARTSA